MKIYTQILIMRKQYDHAEKLITQAKKISIDSGNYTTQALLYAAKGKKDDALRSLKETVFKENRYYGVAIFSLLGLKDDALKLLDSKPIGKPSMAYFGSDYDDMLNNPFFDNLRDSGQFKVALMEAKGIYEDNLAKYGKIER